MSVLVEKWKAFCEWQKRPSHIPQMTEGHHRCCTCGQEFLGNYCPCCGQSARIGRYSFKNAVLLFLDVWGMGNRGMFRTLRDLILRPGYLIRDYISGMQMAYFPPFKLLFLLVVENQSLRDYFLSGSLSHIVCRIVGSYRNKNPFGSIVSHALL